MGRWLKNIARNQVAIGFAILCLALLLQAGTAVAGSSSEKTILTVTGNISNPNSGKEAHFDRAMLEKLGTTSFKTETEWTEGEIEFTGVLLEKLLASVGANGSVALGTASDGYSTEIPLSEVKTYPVLLALKMNGDYLDPSDKGPIWIMYPWNKVPASEKEAKAAFAIWQLNSLDIR